MSDAIADFVAARERLQQERAALLDRVAKLDELLCVVTAPSGAKRVTASLSVMTSRGTLVRHRGADGRWIYSLPAKAVQS